MGVVYLYVVVVGCVEVEVVWCCVVVCGWCCLVVYGGIGGGDEGVGVLLGV